MFFSKEQPYDEFFYTQLQKDLRKASKGKINKARRQMIAAVFVKNFDFGNTAATHKSIRSWADYLAKDYLSKNATT